ncbi:MAG TPA: acyltransferase family protein [Luteibacter sp.]|jgi:surface polysaccharide O-acyltransferase-like enzyme|nr:acyltransferase family protein [Luteibacter sp.]
MQDTRSGDRSLGMDVTRAAACAMVVLLHISAGNFYSFGPFWVPADIYDSLSRVAVPIFFMLSGALLLWRDEPILPFYRKRVLRVVLPLIFWTCVYVYMFGDRSVPIIDSVTHYLTVPYGHLWYFYAALGLYLSAPYLGKILRASTDTEIRVFLALWFFVACGLNQFRNLHATSWDPTTIFGAQMFSGYLGYFVIGAYLARNRPVTSTAGRWYCILTFLASSTATAYLTYLYSMHIGKPSELFFVFQAPLVAVAAVAAFAFFTSITSLPRPLATPVKLISDCSLGIYCLHPMIILFYLNHTHVGDNFHITWLRVPVLWAAIFGSTTVVIYVARKVRLIRRVA